MIPGALQYKMDTGVWLRLSNPGTFSDSDIDKNMKASGESRSK